MCHEPFKLITGINLGWGGKARESGEIWEGCGGKAPEMAAKK